MNDGISQVSTQDFKIDFFSCFCISFLVYPLHANLEFLTKNYSPGPTNTDFSVIH